MGETKCRNAGRRRSLTRRATLAAAMAARYTRVVCEDSDGRIPATFEVIFLTGWAPHPSQQQPLRPGSAATRLADVLGCTRESRLAAEKNGRIDASDSCQKRSRQSLVSGFMKFPDPPHPRHADQAL